VKKVARDQLAPPGVATRPVIVVATGILVFLAAAIGGLGLVFYAAVPRELGTPPKDLPTPRLQTHAPADLRALRAGQRRTLSAYPIERAMREVVARGEQAYEPIASSAGGKP
jgi:hypothetical protein